MNDGSIRNRRAILHRRSGGDCAGGEVGEVMAYEYKVIGNGRPVDPDRCKASVLYPGRWTGHHQCKRKKWRDGWCKQHHPDEVKRRREERDKRWEEEHERTLCASPSYKLKLCQEENAALRQRVQRLEEACTEYLEAHTTHYRLEYCPKWEQTMFERIRAALEDTNATE